MDYETGKTFEVHEAWFKEINKRIMDNGGESIYHAVEAASEEPNEDESKKDVKKKKGFGAT